MRFGVMGAGAVGCYYGAMLARAGHEVVLVGRPAFVEAVAAQGGLILETAAGTETVPVETAADPSALEGTEVVLCCVKSGDTEVVGIETAPYLANDVPVLSFQNGVDNAERLGAILGRPVVPVAVYVAAGMEAPGHVKHHGRGELVMGVSLRGEELATTFTEAGLPTTLSETVEAALWSKLVMNCAYNAFSAVTQRTYGVMTELESVRAVMGDVLDECRAVAKAAGIELAGPSLDQVIGLSQTMPNQYSSTAQDMARGKPTEIDHLNGLVVRKGKELGVPTPANRVLWAMVKLAETKP